MNYENNKVYNWKKQRFESHFVTMNSIKENPLTESSKEEYNYNRTRNGGEYHQNTNHQEEDERPPKNGDKRRGGSTGEARYPRRNWKHRNERIL